jgi:glutamate synthase (NADPH/NADH) large chain
LRDKHFHGVPERVMQFFEFMARDVRELLAMLGATEFTDIIGRSELLEQLPGSTIKHSRLDLAPVLASAGTRNELAPHCTEERNQPFDPGRLNQKIFQAARDAVEQGTKWSGEFDIRNDDRAVGATVSGHIAGIHGREGLPPDSIQVSLKGTAGQSLGAWNTSGLNILLEGDANDYVGKGMSGGRIVLTTADSDRKRARRNVICGNACLYGASGGELFAHGQAGERFAVRNSGATAVIEGAGHHACEYMTGGTIVIMGPTGPNLAAGMTGGELFVLDRENRVADMLNPEFVEFSKLEDQKFDAPRRRLHHLITIHTQLTGSEWGRKVLDEFDLMVPYWAYILPQNWQASEAISQQDVPLRLVKA